MARQRGKHYARSLRRGLGEPKKGHQNEAGLGVQGRLPGRGGPRSELRHRRQGGKGSVAHHSPSQEGVLGETREGNFSKGKVFDKEAVLGNQGGLITTAS